MCCILQHSLGTRTSVPCLWWKLKSSEMGKKIANWISSMLRTGTTLHHSTCCVKRVSERVRTLLKKRRLFTMILSTDNAIKRIFRRQDYDIRKHHQIIVQWEDNLSKARCTTDSSQLTPMKWKVSKKGLSTQILQETVIHPQALQKVMSKMMNNTKEVNSQAKKQRKKWILSHSIALKKSFLNLILTWQWGTCLIMPSNKRWNNAWRVHSKLKKITEWSSALIKNILKKWLSKGYITLPKSICQL